MRTKAIILTLLLSNILLGQNDSLKVDKDGPFREIIDVSYGTYVFNNSFQNQLNSFDGF